MSARRLIGQGLTRKDTDKGKRDGTRRTLYYEVWPQVWGAKFSLTERGRQGAAISVNEAFIFAQLPKNLENACIKARRHGLAAARLVFFLRTPGFRVYGMVRHGDQTQQADHLPGEPI